MAQATVSATQILFELRYEDILNEPFLGIVSRRSISTYSPDDHVSARAQSRYRGFRFACMGAPRMGLTGTRGSFTRANTGPNWRAFGHAYVGTTHPRFRD